MINRVLKAFCYITTDLDGPKLLVFAHPESRYFSLGKIDRDQVVDYHERKGMSVAEVERWLGQNLNYDPAE